MGHNACVSTRRAITTGNNILTGQDKRGEIGTGPRDSSFASALGQLAQRQLTQTDASGGTEALSNYSSKHNSRTRNTTKNKIDLGCYSLLS